MKCAGALFELGVREDTLSSSERSRLDKDGFLLLAGVLPSNQVAAIARRLDELREKEGSAAGIEVHQEPGTDRLSDLANKDPLFDVCFTHPKVLAGVSHVLCEDLKLSSLNSRAALPGQGRQGLHADWHEAVSPGEYQVCNSIWLIDDFTENNGATRIVPGSHHSGRLPHEDLVLAPNGEQIAFDPQDAHPQEVRLVAPAGTVMVFNSHVWHGGTLNLTEKPRRALHSYFCRRHQPQQLDQKKFIRPETYARLSEAARFILDV